MAKPTVYMWTDPGAPQVQYNSESSYQNLFQKVLIDGYGDKLPPGDGQNPWSIPFSDSSSFVLKQGGTHERKCCIKLYGMYKSNGTSYGSHFHIHKADDFIDLNTPVGEWESPSSYHRACVGFATSSSYNIPWIILATERTIICHFGANDKGTDTLQYDTIQTYGVCNHQWMFGDYEPYDPTMTTNQLCIHYYSTGSSSYDYMCAALNSADWSSSAYPRKVVRGNHNDELGCYPMTYFVTSGLDVDSFYSSGKPNSRALGVYPNKLDGGLYLEPSRVFADDGFLGVIPGLLYPLQSRPFPNDGHLVVLNGTGNYSGSKIYAFESRCDDEDSSTYRGQYFIHDGEWGVD